MSSTAPGNPELSARWLFDRRGAIRRICDAYEENGCSALETYRTLRISKATYFRWLSQSQELRIAIAKVEHEHMERMKS